jgi:LmbE family N-acetylglucosaminyl deacetylase
MNEKGKVLVISAHPDDEVLGCGGTIARLTQHGYPVCIAILGEGVTSRYRTREEAPVEETARIREQASRAATLLGAGDLRMFKLPDNRFDTVPLIDIIKMIEDLIGDLRPDVIYTHHPGDLNVDHSRTFRAVLTAVRPLPDRSVRALYTFEVPSSTEWAFQQFSPPMKPNLFVDIRDTLETKIRALQVYESEVRTFPHPRSADAMRAMAYRWGSVAGLPAAEAFELVRRIR